MGIGNFLWLNLIQKILTHQSTSKVMELWISIKMKTILFVQNPQHLRYLPPPFRQHGEAAIVTNTLDTMSCLRIPLQIQPYFFAPL